MNSETATRRVTEEENIDRMVETGMVIASDGMTRRAYICAVCGQQDGAHQAAGVGVRVEAHGKVSDKGLEGEAGSGKMTLDLHLKLDGRLKTDATLGARHVGGAGEGELRR